MGRVNRGRKRREELQECAEIRRQERTQRSPAQQVAELDNRLGVRVGAVKERKRLAEEVGRLESERGKKPKVDQGKRERSRTKDRRKTEKDRSRSGRRRDR